MSALATPTRRIVLLGASNVVRTLATAIDTARHIWQEPLDILVAHGYGRSYGKESTFFSRRLCGILRCGLWDALRNRPPLPTAALVTDVGNDILYGVPPERLLAWVGECLDRLEEHQSTTLLTQLPIEPVRRLSPSRYALLRRVLFPTSTLTLNQAIELSTEIHDRLLNVAQQRKVPVFPVQSEWYGWDAVHVKRACARQFWSTALCSWRDTSESLTGSYSRWWLSNYLRCLAPEERTEFGLVRRCDQPSGLLRDGSRISLF